MAEAILAIELVVESQPGLRGNRVELGIQATQYFPDLQQQVWEILKIADDTVRHLPKAPVKVHYWTTG